MLFARKLPSLSIAPRPPPPLCVSKKDFLKGLLLLLLSCLGGMLQSSDESVLEILTGDVLSESMMLFSGLLKHDLRSSPAGPPLSICVEASSIAASIARLAYSF